MNPQIDAWNSPFIWEQRGETQNVTKARRGLEPYCERDASQARLLEIDFLVKPSQFWVTKLCNFDRGTVTVSGITIICLIAFILSSLTQKGESTPQAKDECQTEDAQASLLEGESPRVRFQVSVGQTEELVGVPLLRSSVIPFPREPALLVLVSIGRSHFGLLRRLFLIEDSSSQNSSRQRLLPLQPRDSSLGADLSVAVTKN